MDLLWQVALHTPVWVYFLLGYIIKSGITAAKPQKVSLRRLCIMPLIFAFVSMHTLLANARDLGAASLSVWVSFALLGGLSGLWLTLRLPLKVDRHTALVEIPGTWSTLMLMLIIFCAKYFWGYQSVVNPQYTQQVQVILSMYALSAFCGGMLLGKLAGYLTKLKNAAMRQKGC